MKASEGLCLMTVIFLAPHMPTEVAAIVGALAWGLGLWLAAHDK